MGQKGKKSANIPRPIKRNDGLDREKKKESVNRLLEIIFIGISAGMSVAAIVISILTLVHQNKYDAAEYAYKRSPVLKFHSGVSLQLKYVDGERVEELYPHGLTVEVESLNNLDCLYGVAPDYTVERIGRQLVLLSLYCI